VLSYFFFGTEAIQIRNNSETKEKHGKKDTIRLRFLLVLYGFFLFIE